MSHPISKVVSANTVETGDTVYLTACDEWTVNLSYAEVIDDPEHADFRLFVASRQDKIVSNPILQDVPNAA